jgi:hypothetical protein
LTAFETDLVEAAGTGFLALVTATSGLAKARTDTAANVATRMLGAFGRLQRIELSL